MNNSFFRFLIFAHISPEIHGLVLFLGDKVFVRIGQHNLKVLLILSNKSCVASFNVNIVDYVIKIGQG